MLKIISSSSISDQFNLGDGIFINLKDSLRFLNNDVPTLNACIKLIQYFTNTPYFTDPPLPFPAGWQLRRLETRMLFILGEGDPYREPRLYLLFNGKEFVIIALEKSSTHKTKDHTALLKTVCDTIVLENRLQREHIAAAPPEEKKPSTPKRRSPSPENFSGHPRLLSDITTTSLHTEEGQKHFSDAFTRWKKHLLNSDNPQLFGEPGSGYFLRDSKKSQPVLITAKENVWNKILGALGEAYTNAEPESKEKKDLAEVLISSWDLTGAFLNTFDSDIKKLMELGTPHAVEATFTSTDLTLANRLEKIDTAISSTPTHIPTLLTLLKGLSKPHFKKDLDILIIKAIEKENLLALQTISGVSKSKGSHKDLFIFSAALFFDKTEIAKTFVKPEDLGKYVAIAMKFHQSKPTDSDTWLSSLEPFKKIQATDIKDVENELIETEQIPALQFLFDISKEFLQFPSWRAILLHTSPENNPRFFTDQNLREYTDRMSQFYKDDIYPAVSSLFEILLIHPSIFPAATQYAPHFLKEIPSYLMIALMENKDPRIKPKIIDGLSTIAVYPEAASFLGHHPDLPLLINEIELLASDSKYEPMIMQLLTSLTSYQNTHPLLFSNPKLLPLILKGLATIIEHNSFSQQKLEAILAIRVLAIREGVVRGFLKAHMAMPLAIIKNLEKICSNFYGEKNPLKETYYEAALKTMYILVYFLPIPPASFTDIRVVSDVMELLRQAFKLEASTGKTNSILAIGNLADHSSFKYADGTTRSAVINDLTPLLCSEYKAVKICTMGAISSLISSLESLQHCNLTDIVGRLAYLLKTADDDIIVGVIYTLESIVKKSPSDLYFLFQEEYQPSYTGITQGLAALLNQANTELNYQAAITLYTIANSALSTPYFEKIANACNLRAYPTLFVKLAIHDKNINFLAQFCSTEELLAIENAWAGKHPERYSLSEWLDLKLSLKPLSNPVKKALFIPKRVRKKGSLMSRNTHPRPLSILKRGGTASKSSSLE
jgi:hypothetical protein